MNAFQFTAVSLILAIFTTAYTAQSFARDSPYGKPIYNPASKSYFELRGDNEPHGLWDKAFARAAALEYKGVAGRLAVVEDPETHKFLARNFNIDQEAWIGLRYWCTYRKLQWVTGKVMELGAFGAWAGTWHRSDLPPCEAAHTKNSGYMSVYYTSTDRGFRWQAVGSGKAFPRYFVEYPTGHE